VKGLLVSEVRRLTARRMARILAVAALVVIVLVEGKAFLSSNRDLAAARRRAAANAGVLDVKGERFRLECESLKASDQLPPDLDCASPQAVELVQGRVELPTEADFFQDPRLHAAEHLPGGARAVTVGVAIIGFVVGASYVGADWHAGTMQALLFWEPRRARVLLAKALALVGVVVAFAAVLQVLVYGATYLTAATRGTTEGVTGGLQMSVLLTVLRGMAVVSVTSLLGFGVAGLARVTAASLGVAFVYFVILENLIRGLRPGWQRYLFSENVSAVLLKKLQVSPAHRTRGEIFGGEELFYQLTGVRGAVTLAVYLGLLLGAFYVTFARRDVT
jgi:ABC-type transport system involved in multi-copper enzyme maturation permease subunit